MSFTGKSDEKVKNQMGKVRNIVVSAISGVLFAAGWWIFIDGAAWNDQHFKHAGAFVLFVPGILATLGLFLINNLKHEIFDSGENSWGWGDEVQWWEKALIVFSVMLSLASLILAIWIYIAKYSKGATWQTDMKWEGICSIIQAALIVASTYLWRFAWKYDDGY